MANKAARAARAKKREKIRLGPSEKVQAYYNLLGINVQPWSKRHGYVHKGDTGERMLKVRTDVTAWYASVENAPHVAKMIYATCDEQWIAELKLLKIRADKFNAEHPDTVVLPWHQDYIHQGRLVKGIHYGKNNWNFDKILRNNPFEGGKTGRIQSDIYAEAFKQMNQISGVNRLMIPKSNPGHKTATEVMMSMDLADVESRVAAHCWIDESQEIKRTTYAALPKEGLRGVRSPDQASEGEDT